MIEVVLPAVDRGLRERRGLHTGFARDGAQPVDARAREMRDQRPDRPDVRRAGQGKLFRAEARNSCDQVVLHATPAFVDSDDRAQSLAALSWIARARASTSTGLTR